MSQDKKKTDENHIVIGTSYTQSFTENAQQYFQKTVKDYADRLNSEAASIERMEHVRGGPPEITAAHVEEAKWVLVRRYRRKARSSKWLYAIRFGQFASSFFVGIGASNFAQWWGSYSSIGGILLASILFIIEREYTRE